MYVLENILDKELLTLNKGFTGLTVYALKQRKNPDIVIVDEEVRPNQVESVVEVNCPICWNSFPAPDIEEHASECNQYSPDNTCSSAKV